MTGSKTAFREGWLACRIDKGMFNDERAISYPPTGKHLLSVFVPSSQVAGGNGEIGKVRVKIERNNGDIMAILPSSYSDSVFVSESEVSEAP